MFYSTINFTLSFKSIILGCIYRPKILKNNKGVMCDKDVHIERDNKINESIGLAGDLVKSGKYKGLIVGGDFNFNEITWNEFLEPAVIGDSEAADKFIDTLDSRFLTQNI